jgi:hypothetical protein
MSGKYAANEWQLGGKCAGILQQPHDNVAAKAQ